MTRINDVAGIIGGRILPKRIGSLIGITDANGLTFWFDLDQRFAISHAAKDNVKACVIQIEGHPGAVYNETEPKLPERLAAVGAHDCAITLDDLKPGARVAIQYDGRTMEGQVKINESGVAFVEIEGGCLIRSAITKLGFFRADMKCPTAADVADVEGRAARAAAEGGSGILGTIRPGEGLQPAPLGSAENPHLAELSAAELDATERELAEAARELGLDDQAAAAEEAAQKRDAGTT